MPTAWNSILNEDWYNRLKERVTESATSGIRGTGSEPTDPFWRAREQQGLAELGNVRREAEQARYNAGQEQTVANIRRARARDAQRNQAISASLNRAGAANVSDDYLGNGASDMGATLQQPQMPVNAPMVSAPPPPAYVPAPIKIPQSSGYGGVYKSPSAYNPSQFANPALDKRRRALENYYADMAKGWK
jgi:hypothetical protein